MYTNFDRVLKIFKRFVTSFVKDLKSAVKYDGNL